MSFNLIVPAAAYKDEYENNIPFIFNLNKNGISWCVNSILGLSVDIFDTIYFTIIKSLDQRFCLSDLLQLQFKRLGLSKCKIVVLDSPTGSEPETIYQTIKKEDIKGSIFIKDADCYFTIKDVYPQNSIVIGRLETLSWVNPQNKSYVSIDDMFYVTNIIEKRIVSRHFCAGGYCFVDVEGYCSYFEKLQNSPRLYLSHIIYAMLLEKNIFRPIIINDYIDYENSKG